MKLAFQLHNKYIFNLHLLKAESTLENIHKSSKYMMWKFSILEPFPFDFVRIKIYYLEG